MGTGPTPEERKAARREIVRAALDPARRRDADRVAEYAADHGVPPDAVLAHLAGRIAAYEVAVDRILALAAHTTADRRLVLREALESLRAPYERAIGDAMALLPDEG